MPTFDSLIWLNFTNRFFYSSFVRSRVVRESDDEKDKKTSFLRLFDYDRKQISCFWLTEEFLAWNRAARRKATALIGSEIHCILKSFLHYLSLMTQIQFRPGHMQYFIFLDNLFFMFFVKKLFGSLSAASVFTLRSPSKSEIWEAQM